MNAQELLTALGGRIGLAELTLDDTGRAALDTSHGVHVELHAPREGAVLNMSAVIGIPRADDCAGLMLDLLKANASASGVCAPCFAFSKETREVVLTVPFPVQSLPVEAAQDALLGLIERAVNERLRLAAMDVHVN